VSAALSTSARRSAIVASFGADSKTLGLISSELGSSWTSLSSAGASEIVSTTSSLGDSAGVSGGAAATASAAVFGNESSSWLSSSDFSRSSAGPRATRSVSVSASATSWAATGTGWGGGGGAAGFCSSRFFLPHLGQRVLPSATSVRQSAQTLKLPPP